MEVSSNAHSHESCILILSDPWLWSHEQKQTLVSESVVLITLASTKTDPQRNLEILLSKEGLVTKEWSADFPTMLRLIFFDTSAIHSNQSIQ